MLNKQKYGIFIGRFQPFHKGHEAMLLQMLTKVGKVIVVLGSARSARHPKNPWTSEEREQMLRSAFTAEQNENIIVTTVRDHFYNEHLWIAEVNQVVSAVVEEGTKDFEVTIFGYHKDSSSYYLDSFPRWKYEELTSYIDVDATSIRHLSFTGGSVSRFIQHLPVSVANWIMTWERENPEAHRGLSESYIHNMEYRAKWSVPDKVPFPVIFHTTDAVIVKSGHILLVERGHNPGKGLHALPGGFVNQKETLIESCLRELREETGLKLPIKTIREGYKGHKEFDYPDRSERGRTITTAYFFDLGAGRLPLVKGGDDARKAMWVPLHKVFEIQHKFFEDHFFIIEHFTRAH
jgi:bifunctional NMN adenylyltransferase/nudix hydrolase